MSNFRDLSEMFSLQNPTTGWCAGASGKVFNMTNEGATWTPQATGTSSNIRYVHFADANNGWACGLSGLPHWCRRR